MYSQSSTGMGAGLVPILLFHTLSLFFASLPRGWERILCPSYSSTRSRSFLPVFGLVDTGWLNCCPKWTNSVGGIDRFNDNSALKLDVSINRVG